MGDIREINRSYRIETRSTLENLVKRNPNEDQRKREQPEGDQTNHQSPRDEVEIHHLEEVDELTLKATPEPKPVTPEDGGLDISA